LDRLSLSQLAAQYKHGLLNIEHRTHHIDAPEQIECPVARWQHLRPPKPISASTGERGFHAHRSSKNVFR